MNKLPIHKQRQIINLLVEGNSLRAASRITGASINTVTKLLVDIGKACMDFHDKNMLNIPAKTVQCDEIWSFIHTKDKRLKEEDKKGDKGSVWTWVAIDADTRLVISWYVGTRSGESAHYFMADLAGRVQKNSSVRITLYTDGNYKYNEAVWKSFSFKINYGQLVKQYDEKGKYRGAIRTAVIGHPELKKISTSYIERKNLTMRMHMRRFARKTNAHSKKFENHCYAIALHFTYYNFCKVHQTLRVTPAMEARITDDIWEIEDLLALMDKNSN